MYDKTIKNIILLFDIDHLFKIIVQYTMFYMLQL
jgi:hypothetical protein